MPARRKNAPEPGLFSDRAAKRPKSAHSWTPDEMQFAQTMRQIWNQAFRGKPYGHTASDVRHNKFVAIQFYRRNEGLPADDRFSIEDVRIAVNAYAESCATLELRFVCHFRTWFNEAEERIESQLRHLGKTRGAEPAEVLPSADAELAARIRRDFRWLIVHCETSLDRGIPPLERAKDFLSMTGAGFEQMRPTMQRIIEVCSGFDALSSELQRPLRNKARDLFSAVYGKPLGKEMKYDRARLDALQFALFQIGGTK